MIDLMTHSRGVGQGRAGSADVRNSQLARALWSSRQFSEHVISVYTGIEQYVLWSLVCRLTGVVVIVPFS